MDPLTLVALLLVVAGVLAIVFRVALDIPTLIVRLLVAVAAIVFVVWLLQRLWGV